MGDNSIIIYLYIFVYDFFEVVSNFNLIVFLRDFVHWSILSIYLKGLKKRQNMYKFLFWKSHFRRGEMFKRNYVSTNRFKWGEF